MTVMVNPASSNDTQSNEAIRSSTKAITDDITQHILREILTEALPHHFGPSTQLMGEGILDSLAVVELLAYLERRYGISVDENSFDMSIFATIDSLVNYVLESKGIAR